MKKYFIAGLVFLLILSVGLIFYGIWLNNRGEVQITQRMSESKLDLPGVKVDWRELYPKVMLSDVNLYSDDMVDAVTLINGRITETFAPKNSRVRQGEVIFVVENEDISLELKEADANILEATAQLKQTENVYDRQKRLLERKATSAARLDEAETSYKAAQARLEMYKAQRDKLLMQKSRQDVIAPIDGKILVLYRQKGSYVNAGTSLALIGDFSTLYFSTSVDDEDARYLEIGEQAELIFNENDFQKVYSTDYAAGNKGNEQTFTATVERITPPLGEPAAIRNVIWSVDNSSELLESQIYGAVSFQSHSSYRCLTVPLDAIIDTDEPAVFVVTEQETIERRKIKVGVNDGKYIEVLEGLNAGEIVINHSETSLSDGTPVNVTLEDEKESDRP